MFKKTCLMIAALALMALALAMPAWPGTLPTSIIPEGARWVAHLDMEKFVATKLYENLEKDGRLQVNNRDLTRWLKIDLFKDIKGLTIFGLAPDEERIVFAAAGKFDKARLLTLIDLDEEHKEYAYGAYTVYTLGDGENGAFVNDGLIIFSEHRADLERVLDTAAGKAKNFGSSKLHASFAAASSGAFLSGIVENLSEGLALGKEISQSKFVEKAGLMFFSAQEKQENLQVRFEVAADSPESAKNMADVAQGLVAMARLGRGEGRSDIPAFLVDGLQVKLEGKTVRLELSVPSREAAELASRGRRWDFLD